MGSPGRPTRTRSRCGRRTGSWWPETGGAAIAAFPPPHTFFWAREVEINVGYTWYRKDNAGSFSVGVRQGEQEAVERYLANWSLYSAPAGTEQHMAAYFYPTLGDREAAFEAALAFTNGDVYRPLPGYQVLGSHYHTNLGRTLMTSGSVDTRLSDFEVLRAAGITIAGPVDRPRDPTQLEEQHWLFEGAARHSDDTFLVLPQMENSNLLGGHWDLLFSHPVYYVDERPPGTPLVTEHADYGRVYHIGSAADMMTMIDAENMLVYMPHPRTKGSTGYPDAIRETPQFLNDRYRGVGWRWGMGSDLSERRLSGKRVIPLLDDMNNWIAGTALRPKALLAITETYAKAPGDDVYANGPVSYLRIGDPPAARRLHAGHRRARTRRLLRDVGRGADPVAPLRGARHRHAAGRRRRVDLSAGIRRGGGRGPARGPRRTRFRPRTSRRSAATRSRFRSMPAVRPGSASPPGTRPGTAR